MSDARLPLSLRGEREAHGSAHPSLYVRGGKPALDVAGASLLIVALAPLLAVAAVAVGITLGWPVLFSQTRVGSRGRTFRIYKLRTMAPDRRGMGQPWDGADRRVCHKSPDDPRLTAVGRFLRKWSIDELPQLFNVLRGEMSLVGPRPELAEIVERHGLWSHSRHLVKPGITGLWQVSARGEGLLHEDLSLDERYARGVTLAGDVRILLATLPAVGWRRRGA